MYADYSFYVDDYLCGKRPEIPRSEFIFFIKKAERYINRYTHGNIALHSIPECVKLCCCETAETLYKTEKNRPQPGIASQTTGDVSESYKSEDYTAAVGREIRRIIYSYLADTGLLYGGLK